MNDSFGICALLLNLVKTLNGISQQDLMESQNGLLFINPPLGDHPGKCTQEFCEDVRDIMTADGYPQMPSAPQIEVRFISYSHRSGASAFVISARVYTL